MREWRETMSGEDQREVSQLNTRRRGSTLPWEQSSPIQPGKHWQEPSMGLQVPLLVQRQISAQALPYLPLGQTANHEKPNMKTTPVCILSLTREDEKNPLTLWHLAWTPSEYIYGNGRRTKGKHIPLMDVIVAFEWTCGEVICLNKRRSQSLPPVAQLPHFCRMSDVPHN